MIRREWSSRNLYHSGIAALTAGALVRGILDIYGTANGLTRLYWYAGVGFVAAGIVRYFWKFH